MDNKEQVNQFSTDELRQLFSLRKDTRSDTHDTLRCKRCNSVKVLDYNVEKNNFSDAQIEACIAFLDEYSSSLVNTATQHREKESSKNGLPRDLNGPIKLPFEADLQQLKNMLVNKEVRSLPAYSRKQRETFQAIDTYHINAKKEHQKVALQKGIDNAIESVDALDEDVEEYAKLFPSHFSLFSDFLNSWSNMVPKLAALAAGKGSSAVSGGEDDEDEVNKEFVEQEGCPEESDFNKWSHHCSVDTCDDDILMKSMRYFHILA